MSDHSFFNVSLVHSSHLQVTPPELVKPRYHHSITASRLGPGLTKVVVFGGLDVWNDNPADDVPIADTATLEFGKSLAAVVCRTLRLANVFSTNPT